MMLDGKRKRWGVVRNAKDPQRMVNYWETCATETIALAPKAKWIIAEGQDEGHENEWAQANVKATAVLRYKQTDVTGQPAPPPQRIQPESPPVGIFSALQGATQNMREVIGMADPAQRVSGNLSGKALRGEQLQQDLSNYHFYDNLTRSLRHTGKIILDWIPHYYNSERIVRVIGDDGRPDQVTINEKNAIGTIENDVTVGEYDVVMDTGPGYNSKRQEAVEVFTDMLATPLGEKIAQVADDIIIRQLDVPGAEAIADRLAAANPMAQIDDKSDIPPQAQMQIKQLQGALQKAGEQVQALQQEIKLKTSIVQFQETEETKRAHLMAATKAHDTEMSTMTKRHDTETRALTAQNVEELKGLVAILNKHLDGAEAVRAFERQSQLADRQTEQVANG